MWKTRSEIPTYRRFRNTRARKDTSPVRPCRISGRERSPVIAGVDPSPDRSLEINSCRRPGDRVGDTCRRSRITRARKDTSPVGPCRISGRERSPVIAGVGPSPDQSPEINSCRRPGDRVGDTYGRPRNTHAREDTSPVRPCRISGREQSSVINGVDPSPDQSREMNSCRRPGERVGGTYGRYRKTGARKDTSPVRPCRISGPVRPCRISGPVRPCRISDRQRSPVIDGVDPSPDQSPEMNSCRRPGDRVGDTYRRSRKTGARKDTSPVRPCRISDRQRSPVVDGVDPSPDNQLPRYPAIHSRPRPRLA